MQSCVPCFHARSQRGRRTANPGPVAWGTRTRGGASKALLGKPLAQARGHVEKIEGVRTVATFHPRWLLQRPSDKARAWADLLLLTEDEV